MPIKHSLEIRTISEEDFHLLDYEVMRIIFSIHNEFGRFWDEKIYQNELAYRCQKAGFAQVITEVPIQVIYEDFKKLYFVDLLLNNAVIYELKTVKTLLGVHHKQTLNYIFLLALQHGKLVNLQSQSVEFSFVSTRLTSKKRYNFTIDDSNWKSLDEDSMWLKQLLMNLLNEWGAFLELKLFYDAIFHFRGGKEHVEKKINIANGQQHVLGTQKLHLLNPEIAFKLSSVTKDTSYYEQHLRRFIRYTSLKAIQWINFKHDRIIFKTIFQ